MQNIPLGALSRCLVKLLKETRNKTFPGFETMVSKLLKNSHKASQSLKIRKDTLSVDIFVQASSHITSWKWNPKWKCHLTQENVSPSQQWWLTNVKILVLQLRFHIFLSLKKQVGSDLMSQPQSGSRERMREWGQKQEQEQEQREGRDGGTERRSKRKSILSLCS